MASAPTPKNIRKALKRSTNNSPKPSSLKSSQSNHLASRTLLRACLNGNLERVKSIFQQHPTLDVNHANLAKETPLFFAAATSAPLCRFLLERGANPLIRATGNRTVAHQLARLGDAKLWAEFNQLDNFKKLLKKELQTDNDWTHPLHLAAKWGNVELMRDAFPPKWDLDVKDLHGATPLIFAIGEGRYEVALYLLSKNVKLSINSTKFRSREMLRDTKHPALHIMVVNECLVSKDRTYKKVMKELIAQKAPMGCLFCSEGKGCTAVAKRRLPKYRKLKESLKIESTQSKRATSDDQIKSNLLSLMANEGTKGGLWRGVMKAASKESKEFGRNLNLLFQSLEIEDNGTRAVLVNEIENRTKASSIVGQHVPYTHILLEYLRTEGKSFLDHFSKVFYEHQREPSASVLARHFFSCVRTNICFFPSTVRALLLDTYSLIDKKFQGEVSATYLKGNLFIRFLSHSLFSKSSSPSPISPELKKETHTLIKGIVSGRSGEEKCKGECEFIYTQFLDPQFHTSSSMLRVNRRSRRLEEKGKEKEKEDEEEEEEEEEEEDESCNEYFSSFFGKNIDLLEDAILMRAEEEARRETAIKCQLVEYFGNESL